MNIILIGAPGCGKGTQAEHIVHSFDLYHVSPGDMIREEVKKRTKFGMQAKKITEHGDMLDDDLVMHMVHEHLGQTQTNLLFDGFPRSVKQAKLLDSFYHIDAVIDIQIQDKTIIDRVSNRYMVELDNKQHSFIGKEAAQKFVDVHGGTLFQRKDDARDVVTNRIKVYHKQTEPLISYYGKQHKLFIVNGEKTINQVWNDIEKILQKISQRKQAHKAAIRHL
ncbi:MAG: adenylate kinase family protein [Candidatus Woesearchaeota archaeon]